MSRYVRKLEQRVRSYQAEEERRFLKGCVVVFEKNAISGPDKKKLEKLGAVVIERKPAYGVQFTWPPPSGGL